MDIDNEELFREKMIEFINLLMAKYEISVYQLDAYAGCDCEKE